MLAAATDTITILPNPTDSEMYTLIQQAHVLVLPSFQNTGMKLKLLYSLFAGRFILLNKSDVDSGIKKGLVMAADTAEYKEKVLMLMNQEFSEEALNERKVQMQPYMNEAGAQIIAHFLSKQ
jgi:hypothetical protein